MHDATTLPMDLEACHALLLGQAQSILELQQRNESLAKENEELNLLTQKLLERLAGHRSERLHFDPQQLLLSFPSDGSGHDALAATVEEAERIIQEFIVRRAAGKKKKPRNDKLPDHLERYEVIVNPPDAQLTCPEHGEKKLIGYDITESLEYERPKLRVRVTKYGKFVCTEGECGVLQAPRPKGPVEGDRYSTSVAAEIITAKYGYHLPLYRQQDVMASSGWVPSRSTLLNILAAAEEVLRPLVEYFRKLVVLSGLVGCDDTTTTLVLPAVIPAIDPLNPRSARIHEVLSKALEKGEKSVQARMWAYRSIDVPINLFDFTVSRHRDGPDEVLQDFTGVLIGDCWSGFQKIEVRSSERIQHAACWSHARRKVLAGKTGHELQATNLLAMIGQLYGIEGRGKDMSPEQRLALRQSESRSVLDRIQRYLASEAIASVLPKSKLAEAIRYLRNNWPALTLYLTDANIPIDNNDVEQLMKRVALGRKNWLMVGSVAAGMRTATLMTMVSSAVRNDLDVALYIKDVLDQLLAGSTDYHALRPDVWKEQHPEAIRQYREDERRDQADRRSFQRAKRHRKAAQVAASDTSAASPQA